jgi:hypothetical protein
MYVKQLIAGLMFLAVTNVRADDHEGMEDAETELYEASPEPDLEDIRDEDA